MHTFQIDNYKWLGQGFMLSCHSEFRHRWLCQPLKTPCWPVHLQAQLWAAPALVGQTPGNWE